MSGRVSDSTADLISITLMPEKGTSREIISFSTTPNAYTSTCNQKHHTSCSYCTKAPNAIERMVAELAGIKLRATPAPNQSGGIVGVYQTRGLLF